MFGLTVHICPMCDWCVSYDVLLDPADLEQVLREHLDGDHPGWTLEQLIESRGVCGFCKDSGWVEDQNWEPDYPGVKRVEENGLIRCSCQY